MQDKLVILDFDHAIARIAARMLRSERICCKILPGDTAAQAILSEDPCGVILCASGDSVFTDPDGLLFSCPVPMLAFGSAAAGMAVSLGGSFGTLHLERRLVTVRYGESPLFDGMSSASRMISCLIPLVLPAEVQTSAVLEDFGLPYAFSAADHRRFGTLMELEPHDPDSITLLTNFAQRVCGCTAWWDEDAFVSQAVGEIRRSAGDGSALCMMTGGLHASVSALLGARALGSRLIGVFVNTGLLQEGEEQAFERFFAGRIHLRLSFLDESGRFLQALRGIRDQEEKRYAVHSLMNVISREVQRQHPDLSLIIQDRTYAEQPHEEMPSVRRGLTLLEPLQDLFLDEVRQVGSYLGLPYDMIAGQIIPDTGLALNIIGEVTEEKLSILRRADAVFRGILQQSGQSKKLGEYYAVLRPYEKDTYSVILRALGINQGGGCLRAARTPYDVLEESAETIRRECPQVKRVLYDLTPTSR